MNAISMWGRRIRYLSNTMRVFCWMGLALILTAGLLWLLSADPKGFKAGSFSFTAEERYGSFEVLGRPLIAFVILLQALFLYLLQRLMGFFAEGIIFAGETVGCVRAMGWWMIFVAFAPILTQMLEKQIERGETVIHLQADGYLFGGLLTFLIAWIIDEGRKLQEEQNLVV